MMKSGDPLKGFAGLALRATTRARHGQCGDLKADNDDVAIATEDLESAMPENRSFQQAILDSLPAQIAVLDQSAKIILVNEAWRRFGREARCFCIAYANPGKDYFKLCQKSGATGAEVANAIEEVLHGARPSFSREFACHSRQEQHWFLLSVTPLKGRQPGVVISRTDITAQKLAAAARAQLAAIVESSSSAITAATLNGIVMSWNKGAERLFGYAANEIIGSSIRLLVPRDRYSEFETVFQKLRSGETVETFETIRRHKNGRLIPVEVTVSAIRDEHGTIVGASGITRDATERRRLQAEVLRATEAEDRRIARDLHDGLTQHVAGIACLAKVLGEKLANDNSPHAEVATKIANLLDEATTETRHLARGLYPVPPEPTGLMSALQSLAQSTREMQRIDCSFNCRRPVPVRDSGVANHLYRIAQEAVTNAIRHGRAGHIEIVLSQTNAHITLAVRDDGIGIRHRPDNKGIGLRVMHHRANLISGTLAVQRRADKGTEMICTVNPNNHVAAIDASEA